MLFKLKSVVTSLTRPAVTSVSNQFNKIQRSVFIGTVDQFLRLLKHMQLKEPGISNNYTLGFP